MKKTIKAWAVITPHGSVLLWTVSNTRRETISTVNRESPGGWDVWKSNGNRIRRITITKEWRIE